jgi:Tfp pilus assembly protein PilO
MAEKVDKQIKKYRILSIAVVLVFIYVLTSKVIPEYVYLWEQITAYRSSVAELKTLTDKEKLIGLKQNIARIRQEVNELNLKIPGSRELSRPLQSLDSLRLQNDVILDGLQVTKIDTSRQYQFVYLQVNLQGKFDNIKNFIRQIENNSMLIVVQSFDLRLESLSKKDLVMKLSLLVLARIEKEGRAHVT